MPFLDLYRARAVLYQCWITSEESSSMKTDYVFLMTVPITIVQRATQMTVSQMGENAV